MDVSGGDGERGDFPADVAIVDEAVASQRVKETHDRTGYIEVVGCAEMVVRRRRDDVESGSPEVSARTLCAVSAEN